MKPTYRTALLLLLTGCGGLPFVASAIEDDHAPPNDEADSGGVGDGLDGASGLPDSSASEADGAPPAPGDSGEETPPDGGDRPADSGGERPSDGGTSQVDSGPPDAMGSLGWACNVDDNGVDSGIPGVANPCYGTYSLCSYGQGYCTSACDAGCPTAEGYQCDVEGAECVR